MFETVESAKKEILEQISKLSKDIDKHSDKNKVYVSAAIKNLSDAYVQLDMLEVMHIGK